MSLEIGETIDQYRVEEVIGQGGMAVVYRVRHLQLESDHALKVLTITSSAVKRRLLQEGRAQAQLRHPNVVSVIYVVDVKGCPGLVMELVDGPALDAFLHKHILSFDQVDRLAGGILAGVAEAHAHDLIHRDLKPANIMLARTSSGLVPKVADFGLVKVLAEDRALSRTRSGLTMGTPRYMAPEQIRDAKHVDARADIFSMGAILYEMATRQQAFPGDDTLELFKAIDEGRFIPPREHVPDLPQRMEDAICSALQVKRDDRPASIRQLQRIWQGRAPGVAPIAGADVSIAVTEATLGEGDGAALHVEGELDTPTARIPAPSGAPPDLAPPADADEAPPQPEPVATKRVAWWWAAAALLLMVGAGAWRVTGSEGGDPAPSPIDRIEAPADAEPTRDPAAADLATGPLTPAPPNVAVATVAPSLTRAGPRDSEGSPASAASAASTPPPREPAPVDAAQPSPEAAPAAAPPEEAAPPSVAPPAAAPTPSAAPARPLDAADVRFEGARTIWLESDQGRFEAGTVPAGRYRVTVFFDGVEPVTVGEITLNAGEQRVLRCSASLRSCR